MPNNPYPPPPNNGELYALVNRCLGELKEVRDENGAQRETIRALLTILVANGTIKDPKGHKLKYLREGGNLTLRLTHKGLRVETNIDSTEPMTIWEHICEA